MTRQFSSPARAEVERERTIERAVAEIVGPVRARELMASPPTATAEPALSAYEASRLRRAAAARAR